MLNFTTLLVALSANKMYEYKELNQPITNRERNIQLCRNAVTVIFINKPVISSNRSSSGSRQCWTQLTFCMCTSHHITLNFLLDTSLFIRIISSSMFRQRKTFNSPPPLSTLPQWEQSGFIKFNKINLFRMLHPIFHLLINRVDGLKNIYY